MTNLIIPINANVEDYISGINKIALNGNAQIYVGITKSLRDKLDINMPNVDITVFEDGSNKEGMINSMQNFLTAGKLIVCRRPISFEEFSQFEKSRSQITYCKESPCNKIVGWIRQLWQIVAKAVFGVKTYQGDHSLICFNEDMCELLSEAENFSFSTRVDRWKGVTQNVIEAKAAPAKAELNRKNTAMLSLAIAVPIVLAVVLTTCLALMTKVSVIGGLFLACFDALCLGAAFFSTLILIFNMKIGQKNFNKAKMIVSENGGENEKG